MELVGRSKKRQLENARKRALKTNSMTLLRNGLRVNGLPSYSSRVLYLEGLVPEYMVSDITWPIRR